MTKKAVEPVKKPRKLLSKSLKVIELQTNTKTPEGFPKLFTREITFLKPRDIKRAMSKLISEYCKGNILNEDAKTATYLFSTYLQILTNVEIEERLKKMESQVK